MLVKRNIMCTNGLKLRTKEAEHRHITYTNKLTSILRFSAKVYYNKLLEREKNNIRDTWKVLNEVVRNKQ